MAISAWRAELGAARVQVATRVIHLLVCRGAVVLGSIHRRESWSVRSVQRDTSAQMDRADRYRMSLLFSMGKLSFWTGRA